MRTGVAIATALLFVSCGVAMLRAQKAPLPSAIVEAKTVFLVNDSDWLPVADKAYAELVKWGRFKVVTDQKAANLIFRFTGESVANGYHTIKLSHFVVGNETAGPIWTVETGGAELVANNAKDCITELRKCLEQKK